VLCIEARPGGEPWLLCAGSIFRRYIGTALPEQLDRPDSMLPPRKAALNQNPILLKNCQRGLASLALSALNSKEAADGCS
jgi:hypothetical protein